MACSMKLLSFLKSHFLPDVLRVISEYFISPLTILLSPFSYFRSQFPTTKQSSFSVMAPSNCSPPLSSSSSLHSSNQHLNLFDHYLFILTGRKIPKIMGTLPAVLCPMSLYFSKWLMHNYDSKKIY